ncbi:MAG: tetratricopeptide repeat protein, partial [Pseudomonadota bacterium]
MASFNIQAGQAMEQALAQWHAAETNAAVGSNRAASFARLALAYEQYDWALQALDWALAHQPKRGDWHYLRAHSLKGQERDDEAMRALDTSLEFQPRYSAARIVLAQWALDANQIERAHDVLSGHSVPGDNVSAWLAVKGRIALAQNQPELAAELLSDALEADPEATQLNYSLGLAYRAMGDRVTAERYLADRGTEPPRLQDALMAAVADSRNDPQALRTRAGEAALAGDHALAVELYQRSLDGEDDLETSINLGISQFRSGDPYAAETTLNHALGTNPEHARGWFALGSVLSSQNRSLEAIDAYQQSLNSNPDSLDARQNLANAYRRIDDHPFAIELYTQVVALDPARLPAWQGLVKCQLAMASWDEAVSTLRQARTVHPDDVILTLDWIRLIAALPEAEFHNPDQAVALARTLFNQEETLPRG